MKINPKPIGNRGPREIFTAAGRLMQPSTLRNRYGDNDGCTVASANASADVSKVKSFDPAPDDTKYPPYAPVKPDEPGKTPQP